MPATALHITKHLSPDKVLLMPSQHFFYAWACMCVPYANEMRYGKESVLYKARHTVYSEC